MLADVRAHLELQLVRPLVLGLWEVLDVRAVLGRKEALDVGRGFGDAQEQDLLGDGGAAEGADDGVEACG